MYITKRAKRMMATVMTMALVLTTGSIIAPKKANAATSGPGTISAAKASVKEDGSALRFLVTATLPKTYTGDLGMKLKVGEGTEKTVSLKTGASKLYSYVEAGDNATVGYSVAITGIPSDAINTSIVATGFADTHEATPVQKTVNSVITDAGYVFGSDGKLIEKGTKLTINEWGITDIPMPAGVNLSDYSGKTVKISMDVRMDGTVPDGTDTSLALQCLDDGYPTFAQKVPFTSEWKTVIYNNKIVDGLKSGTPLYFGNNKASWASKNEVNLYCKNVKLTEMTEEPLTLTANKTIKQTDGNKNCNYADCDGYSASFDITKYAFVSVTYKLYSSEDTVANNLISDLSTVHSGALEIGCALEYFANIATPYTNSMVADDGTITTTLNIADHAVFPDHILANLWSSTDPVKAVVIDSITFSNTK